MSTNPTKECKRCKSVHRQSEFNQAFNCCKKCVVTEDYDNIQPEISQMMREAFKASKRRREAVA